MAALCPNRDPLQGAFGIVTKATAVSIRGRSGVSVVAVKECRTTAFAEDKVNFIRECTLMKQLRHPNVVELLGVCLQVRVAVRLCGCAAVAVAVAVAVIWMCCGGPVDVAVEVWWLVIWR